ncbi:MAG TPA: pyrimidine reductase family protein [Actinomadura sp.]|jgi:riboflavin biosynthesis pyrimidine reductase|nr:pyrimidine reductase family protein [Actinomadura sp.]
MRRLLPDPTDRLDDAALTAQYALPATAGRPHLRLNFVCSVDGAITVEGVSRGLQTPGDNRVYHELRTLADVILVGAGTARTEGYGPVHVDPEQRARRRTLGLSQVPPIAVVTASLDLDPDAPLFTAATTPTVVITCAGAPADRRAALTEVADVIIAGESAVDLPQALTALAERGLTRILCEGGPHLFGSLLAAGCVDELCVTVSPLLTGPGPGRMVAGPPIGTPAGLRLAHILEEDDALFCRYVAVSNR